MLLLLEYSLVRWKQVRDFFYNLFSIIDSAEDTCKMQTHTAYIIYLIFFMMPAMGSLFSVSKRVI